MSLAGGLSCRKGPVKRSSPSVAWLPGPRRPGEAEGAGAPVDTAGPVAGSGAAGERTESGSCATERGTESTDKLVAATTTIQARMYVRLERIPDVLGLSDLNNWVSSLVIGVGETPTCSKRKIVTTGPCRSKRPACAAGPPERVRARRGGWAERPVEEPAEARAVDALT
jgi:hypothetical protein